MQSDFQAASILACPVAYLYNKIRIFQLLPKCWMRLLLIGKVHGQGMLGLKSRWLDVYIPMHHRIHMQLSRVLLLCPDYRLVASGLERLPSRH